MKQHIQEKKSSHTPAKRGKKEEEERRKRRSGHPAIVTMSNILNLPLMGSATYVLEQILHIRLVKVSGQVSVNSTISLVLPYRCRKLN